MSDIKFSNFFHWFVISVFITISDYIASNRGFSVSKELPYPFSYNLSFKNPILEPLADQANQDPSWSSGHLTSLQLKDLIIDALKDNNLQWPINFKYITKRQWIQNMKQNPKYYRHRTNNPTEFQAHERLLLDLASKVLKRKICLISLFPDDKDEMFEPAVLNSSRTYYLLGCNRALYDNFYVSIFKKDWDHLNSSVTTFCLNFFSD